MSLGGGVSRCEWKTGDDISRHEGAKGEGFEKLGFCDLGQLHFEAASLCVVEKIGGSRERRIQLSIVYGETVLSFKRARTLQRGAGD